MRRQQGVIIVELLIAIGLLTLIVVGSVHWLKQRGEQLQVEQLAVWMLEAQQGLQHFISEHKQALLDAEHLELTIEGVMQASSPTLEELQLLGFLSPSFPLTYAVRIRLYQEGDCPGQRCHVQAIMYSEKPLLTQQGVANQQALAQWRLHTQAYGLAVTALRPDWLVGSQMHVANRGQDLGEVLPPGTVALVASTNKEQFVKVVEKATSDPTDTGSIYSDEDLIARRDVLAGRDVSAGRDIQAERYFVLPNTSIPNSVCVKDGAISRAQDGTGLLLCERGRWQLTKASQLDSDVINKALNYVFSITDPSQGFKGDWFNKGGYGQTYIRDMFNYEHWVCTIPNPVTTDGCTCGSSSPLLAHEEQRASYSGTVTTLLFYICT